MSLPSLFDLSGQRILVTGAASGIGLSISEAMLEAGFKSVEVHDRLGGAVDQHGNLHVRPLQDGEPLDESYVVYLVARR